MLPVISSDLQIECMESLQYLTKHRTVRFQVENRKTGFEHDRFSLRIAIRILRACKSHGGLGDHLENIGIVPLSAENRHGSSIGILNRNGILSGLANLPHLRIGSGTIQHDLLSSLCSHINESTLNRYCKCGETCNDIRGNQLHAGISDIQRNTPQVVVREVLSLNHHRLCSEISCVHNFSFQNLTTILCLISVTT